MCLNALKLIFEPLIYGHLSAILNFQYFSKCSRVRFRIPAVIHYVGHKDMETTEKKTISVGTGFTENIPFGNLTMCTWPIIEYSRSQIGCFWVSVCTCRELATSKAGKIMILYKWDIRRLHQRNQGSVF